MASLHITLVYCVVGMGFAPVGLARHRVCWADPLYGGDWSAFCDTALVLLEDWNVTHAK